MSKLLRILAFIGGAIGVIVEAIQHAGEITTGQAVLIACTAAMAYAAKWPTDATADEAQERVDRAARRSIMPPPSANSAAEFERLEQYVSDVYKGKVTVRGVNDGPPNQEQGPSRGEP